MLLRLPMNQKRMKLHLVKNIADFNKQRRLLIEITVVMSDRPSSSFSHMENRRRCTIRCGNFRVQPVQTAVTTPSRKVNIPE